MAVKFSIQEVIETENFLYHVYFIEDLLSESLKSCIQRSIEYFMSAIYRCKFVYSGSCSV